MAESRRLAVIWDVDGTLVDTAELHFQAWSELMRQLGRPFSRDDFASTFGWRNPEIIQRLLGERPPAEVAELGERKEVLYRSAARSGVALLPGARALLDGLLAAGFRQAIGSSAPRENLELILHQTGARHFFDAIVSMEDTQRGKPDPQVFLVAAAKLQAEPRDCVVMEDAVVGVQAARSGGMQAIAVRVVGHHPAEKLKAAGADLVVNSLEDVSVETVRDILEGAPRGRARNDA
jgi:beta-phosphoglucomutase